MTADSPLNNFHYLFQDHGVSKTIFLLHGTGGDETDLLPLVAPLRTTYNFVGLKGNVSEQGMARFFERTAAGQFNQANIRQEASKLAAFLQAWYEKNHVSANEVAFVGYSNGANMILALMFLYPALIDRGVLLHPMLPFQPEKSDLQHKKFLLTYGVHDQMIPLTESQKVMATLKKAGAEVTLITHDGGHQIQSQEVTALHAFLQN